VGLFYIAPEPTRGLSSIVALFTLPAKYMEHMWSGVSAIDRQQQRRPAGLLLSALWAESIDSCGRRAAGTGAQEQIRDSIMLIASCSTVLAIELHRESKNKTLNSCP